LSGGPAIVHAKRDDLAFFLGPTDQGGEIESGVIDAFLAAGGQDEKQGKEDKISSVNFPLRGHKRFLKSLDDQPKTGLS
jgi:hypothetical protein